MPYHEKVLMHTQLKHRLDAILKIAQTHHEAGAGMSNSTIGSEREVFVGELLSKIFPNAYRFSSGDIIDARGVERPGRPGS